MKNFQITGSMAVDEYLVGGAKNRDLSCEEIVADSVMHIRKKKLYISPAMW